MQIGNGEKAGVGAYVGSVGSYEAVHAAIAAVASGVPSSTGSGTGVEAASASNTDQKHVMTFSVMKV